MIAIAGSNGGCGKTTTTLGLARALARPDAPVLAVDADRQLPDLHVTAEIDRAPTIAALDPAPDPVGLAQSVPDLPGVSVLPGPKPDESVDVRAVLSDLDGGAATVLVDCPSGIGPDLTDPLSVADRAVVVAAGDGRVADARTTVDIARRLDVPVAGAVVTRTDAVPDGVEAALDVPVLAVVPESAAPLADDATRSAYADAAAALREGVGGTAKGPEDPADGTPPRNATTDRIPTGVGPLDSALGGGVPPGSVVALVADPASHAERVLHRLPAVRGTLYVSTDRAVPLVRAAVETDPGAAECPTVRAVGPEDPVGETADLLADLPPGATLVVDSADALEAVDPTAYGAFLRALRAEVAGTGAIAVLHCPVRGPPSRNRALTQRTADVVVRVEAVATDGAAAVEQRATVTKCRPDPAATGVASLGLGDAASATGSGRGARDGAGSRRGR